MAAARAWVKRKKKKEEEDEHRRRGARAAAATHLHSRSASPGSLPSRGARDPTDDPCTPKDGQKERTEGYREEEINSKVLFGSRVNKSPNGT